MPDLQLRAMGRAVDLADDAPSWLRLCQARLRLADWDPAAHAALMATGTLDTSQVLDQLTPALDDFVAEQRSLEALPLDFRWTPDGAGVYGLTDRASSDEGRPELEIDEIDVASGAARTIVTSDWDHHWFLFHYVHPVMHPNGRYLAFAASAKPEKQVIYTADRRTGEILGEAARCHHGTVKGLALSGSGLLSTKESGQTRVFQLTSSGHMQRPRALRSMKAGGVFLAPDGAGFVRHGHPRQPHFAHEIDFHDVAQALPRASIAAHRHPDLHLHPIGRRLVLVDHATVRLHGSDGELLGAAPRPEQFIGDAVPSPSGRLVAFPFPRWNGPQRVVLLDLRSGHTRSFPVHEPPVARGRFPHATLQCSWSPSGRKLLAGVSGRSCTLLTAP